jgi:hypothetical protein
MAANNKACYYNDSLEATAFAIVVRLSVHPHGIIRTDMV